MDVFKLNFYHGTSSDAAIGILNGGVQESLFEEIGAFELGREVRRTLLKRAGLSSKEDWNLPYYFARETHDLSSPWLSALNQLEGREPNSLFDYGILFVTANIGNAYRYAVSNPYRSEFLHVIAESLLILRRIDDPLADMAKARFPKLMHLIEHPSPPVVLELSGIGPERLLRENGNRDIQADIDFLLMMQNHGGISGPAAFRALNVTTSDIVAVHDLSGWSPGEIDDGCWQPDADRTASIRHAPATWLSKAAGA